MEMEQQPIKTLSYRISLKEYLAFNFELAEQNFAKQKKKTMIMGTIEIVAAVLFLVTLLIQPGETNQTLYLLLDLLLLAFGIYSLVFYRYFFPRQLRKAAEKQYCSNDYLQHQLQVIFYPDAVYEQSGDYENTIPYQELYGFEETDTLLKVMLTKERCILIPKDEVAQDQQELRDLFQELSQKWNLQWNDRRKGQKTK